MITLHELSKAEKVAYVRHLRRIVLGDQSFRTDDVAIAWLLAATKAEQDAAILAVKGERRGMAQISFR